MAPTGRADVGNLGAELTSFVGRRSELSEVKRLLSESRLVTLTGVGGTGKTRLARRAGAQLRREFPDGVWFVDLTQLHEAGLLTQDVEDPDGLTFLITATLGLRRQGGAPLQLLVEQVAERQLLLILDNCEHLIAASAMIADALVRGCPNLRILTTSREPLAATGEALLPVPPLPAPDVDNPASLAELTRYEAVALFLARASSAMPDFELTADYGAVAQLCQRLDGLPLAIELAAARVRALTPQQILARLTDRFALLSRGNRTAPLRQQTLRACVDWSFDLCAEAEKILWARLSVFAGAFELDAVEGICAGERVLETDTLELVAGLVQKSVLIRDDVRDGQSDSARYRMLETLRDYGQEKLHEAEEQAAMRRRHRDWYGLLVQRARAEWVSDRQAYWLARLRREHTNLRAAVEFSLTEPGEAEVVLRIAVSLPWSYWRARGMFGEGQRWLEQALAQSSAETPLRARALLIHSQLAFWQGDAAAATRLLDEGEELARQLGADAELAHAAYLRGAGALFANDLPVAVEALHRAWTTLSAAPEPDPDLYLNVLLAFCVAVGLSGEPDRAVACQREIMTVLGTHGAGLHRSLALWAGGLIAWLQRDLRRAAEQEVKCLRLRRAWESDDRYGAAQCLEVLAWITADQERHQRAATLLGAADALWADIGTSITAFGHYIGHHNARERQVRDALGDAAFTEAFQRGQALTYDDVLAYALEEPWPDRPAPSEDASTPSLTPREQQVADLVALGLSNKDIATQLVISQRTVESHVEHILAKLGFASRAQVAALMTARAGAAD